MAISKRLHMKDSGNSFHARPLKRALDYVMNPEKTQRGKLVGAVNCQADMAFEQMKILSECLHKDVPKDVIDIIKNRCV